MTSTTRSKQRLPSVAGGQSLRKALSAAVCLGFALTIAEAESASTQDCIVTIAAAERTSFLRMEEGAQAMLRVTNHLGVPLTGEIRLTLQEVGETLIVALPAMGAGASHEFAYPIDTSLRPGTYSLGARVVASADQRYIVTEKIPLVIAPRPEPHRMPAFMLWGELSTPQLQRLGFTHFHSPSWASTDLIWEAGKPAAANTPEDTARMKATLNEALAHGLGVFGRAEPGRHVRWQKLEAYYRINKDGVPYEGKEIRANALHPDLVEFAYNVGASLGEAYGQFPAFAGTLIHSEERGRSTAPSFDDVSRARFRDATGLEIPRDVGDEHGVDYRQIEGFPPDRIIPDDHPVYRYYQWFWREGDGWNSLNSAVHRGLHDTVGREGFWTMHPPAVRTPSLYGSGGDVDVLAHWSYVHPGPLNLAMTVDELLAMAGGAHPPKRTIPVIQLFTKRTYVVPKKSQGAALWTGDSPFVDIDPDAAYYAITPDQLRESFWVMVSRGVDGVGWFGTEFLVPDEENPGASAAQPHLFRELQDLLVRVVKPLGPTLLQVPEAETDVAFLESFASQIFAGRGSYGWGFRGEGSVVYQILQYAQLQPQVVYEETILREGLDRYRVLVMPECDVLPQSVAEKVQAFQRRGGIVVGDQHLAPAIKADLLVQGDVPAGAVAASKLMLQRAQQLREALKRRYEHQHDSSDPHVVTHLRRYNSTGYLFAINDRREAGDYFGQHGLVHERGLPSETRLTINRPQGFVYDLLKGEAVDTSTSSAGLQIEARLGPGEGRLFMVTDRAISKVQIDAAAQVKRRESLAAHIQVVDAQAQPIDAVVPLRIDILDPEGREAEFSGYYGAADGQLRLNLDIAANDRAGIWRIQVRELASGVTREHRFRVVE